MHALTEELQTISEKESQEVTKRWGNTCKFQPCARVPEDRQHQVSTVWATGTLSFLQEPGGWHSYLDLCSLAKSIGLYLLQARCLWRSFIILFLFDVQATATIVWFLLFIAKMGKSTLFRITFTQTELKMTLFLLLTSLASEQAVSHENRGKRQTC